MKALTLDLIYHKLEKHLLLVQSYTEINNLSKLLKVCRLKPFSYIYEKENKLILHRWWIDEYGNSFKLTGKIPTIIYNDLNLQRDKIPCTDLYYGLSINKILKLSKTVYVAYGVDEDLYQEYCHMTFIGVDNYLRSFTYMYGEWQQISPLNLGIDTLLDIIKYDDINYFIKLKETKNNLHPCSKIEQWLSSTNMISGLADTIKNDAVNSILK